MDSRGPVWLSISRPAVEPTQLPNPVGSFSRSEVAETWNLIRYIAVTWCLDMEVTLPSALPNFEYNIYGFCGIVKIV
jgi:hypothetical protein